MSTMNIRELLTYLKLLPGVTHFPIGFGLPFIINNVVDQIIFRPMLDMTAEKMAEAIENLVGCEVKSETGAVAVINMENSHVYFGLDATTAVTPINIVFLTILRSMRKADREVTVSYTRTALMPESKTSFMVPDIWWSTLTKKHQRLLALEYLSNRVLNGFNIKVEEPNENRDPEAELQIQDAFGHYIANVD